MLCGGAELVREARRWRKALGGGMRQAGIIAAAGLYALENHVERLAEDHSNAVSLASGLRDIDGVDVTDVQTNMVYVDLGEVDPRVLFTFLRERNVLIHEARRLRLVTHLDIHEKDLETVVDAFKAFFTA